MVLKVLSSNSHSSQNSGSTTLQNQQTQQYTWVQQQSGQPAGQTQYPRQPQFRPVVTPHSTLPAGSGGTPGLGGVGGVQGQMNFGERALVLVLQWPDTIKGAVGLRRLAFGPTIRSLLARDNSPITRRGIDSLKVASKVPHSRQVPLDGARMYVYQ
jgi:hypothetical protein